MSYTKRLNNLSTLLSESERFDEASSLEEARRVNTNVVGILARVGRRLDGGLETRAMAGLAKDTAWVKSVLDSGKVDFDAGEIRHLAIALKNIKSVTGLLGDAEGHVREVVKTLMAKLDRHG